MISLQVSQVLLIATSSSSSCFARVRNCLRFQPHITDYVLPHLICWVSWISQYQNFASLFTYCQSVPLIHRITSTSECNLLSTKIWTFWLCVFPSRDIQVYWRILRCGNIVPVTIRFLAVAKFITPTPLLLLILRNLLFPTTDTPPILNQ
jgi:hypothetical protein